jgi:hypothetical protein
MKVIPDVTKAQKSWIKVKKIYKKKYGIEVSFKIQILDPSHSVLFPPGAIKERERSVLY